MTYMLKLTLLASKFFDVPYNAGHENVKKKGVSLKLLIDSLSIVKRRFLGARKRLFGARRAPGVLTTGTLWVHIVCRHIGVLPTQWSKKKVCRHPSSIRSHFFYAKTVPTSIDIFWQDLKST